MSTWTVSLPAERFWRKVDKSGDCWTWTAALTAGYGSYAVGSRVDGSKRRVLAHRQSWEMANGPIPDGMKILHRCDNPSCVRPDHLFLGTQRDNIDDMVAKHRQNVGVRNGNAELTETEVIAIKRRLQAGESHINIARSIGYSRALVSLIYAGKRWGHVRIA